MGNWTRTKAAGLLFVAAAAVYSDGLVRAMASEKATPADGGKAPVASAPESKGVEVKGEARKAAAKVTDDLFKPNGLCFSPDYKTLYIAETGASHYPEAPRNIRAYDVVDGVKLARGREFASMKLAMPGGEQAGLADGLRADVEGNVYAAAGWVGHGYDGVHVFAPDGARIGQILLPEICGNVCFGGPKRNRLFMAASQSIYAVYVNTRGAHIG